MKRVILYSSAMLVLVFIIAIVASHYWLSAEETKPFLATDEEIQELEFYRQPDEWFIDHLQKPRVQIDSQILDPKFQYMLEQAGDPEKSFGFMKTLFSTPLGRKFIRYRVDREWTLYTKETKPMRQTFDLEIKSRGEHLIPIRIYIPEASSAGKKLPVLVYAHGGGYLFGSIKSHDRVVKLIANEAGMIVVSINYRLAPEHGFPAQSDDGEDVFLWARNHIHEYNGDAERMAFGGDSGGGHVSINLAQRQLEKGEKPPAMLLLYYPATGLPFGDESNALFGKGFGLDSNFFEYILTQVFPGRELATTEPDGYMAPLVAKNLNGMPPTILATAGFDILRDSGKKFADRLKSADVPVFYQNYSTLPHSFLQFSGVVRDAELAATETARMLGEEIRRR